jgi:SSS family solute:Na+ symporter
MLYEIPNPNPLLKHAHFGGSAFPLNKLFDPTTIGLDKKTTMYVGFLAVIVNLVVAILVTLLCKALRAPDGADTTAPDDYLADAGEAPAPADDELPEPAPAT